MTTKAYIGVGSNLGQPKARCLDAVERLRRLPKTRLTGVSPWYLSRPVGVVDQEWFVNGVTRMETRLPAAELLRGILEIEAEMGRVRKQRWEARVIDLDLLIYGNGCIREEGLTVPHPELHLRRFVLVPLADFDPSLVHPVLGRAVGELLDSLDAEGQELIPFKAGLTWLGS